MQCCSLNAQDDVTDSAVHNFIGFNMTEAVSQFVPFTNRVSASGPFQFTWRSGSNGNLFNLQLGLKAGDGQAAFVSEIDFSLKM